MPIVDIFGNRIRSEKIATKPVYSFAEKLGAASTMTVAGTILNKLRPGVEDERAARHFANYNSSPEIDGDVRDYRWMQEKRQIIADFIPAMQEERKENRQQPLTSQSIAYLMESDTYNDFLRRRENVNRQAKALAIFQEHPVAVMGSSIAMSMVEPWNIASLPMALVKTGSKIGSAARLGAFGATQATIEEGILHTSDPNRTIGQSLISVGAAGTITGMFGSYLGKSRGDQAETLEEIQKRLKSIDDEDKIIVDLENDLINPSSNTININLATASELYKSFKNIKGVGRTIAKRIVELRESRVSKSFESLDDLLDEGFSANQIAKINKVINTGRYHASGVALSESGKIVGTYGLSKVAALSSPLMRLTDSPFPEVRRAAQELMTTNFRTTDNLHGVVNTQTLEEILDGNRA